MDDKKLENSEAEVKEAVTEEMTEEEKKKKEDLQAILDALHQNAGTF